MAGWVDMDDANREKRREAMTGNMTDGLRFHVIADAIAKRIAKRENGECYEGYESAHWEAAQDYARAAFNAIDRPPANTGGE